MLILAILKCLLLFLVYQKCVVCVFKCARNDLYETTWPFETKLHMGHLERTQGRNVVLSKVRRSFFEVAITASVGPPFCTVSKCHNLYCGHTTAEKHVVRNG